VTYISNYKPSNENHTLQTEEQHVINVLANFQLNPTINELNMALNAQQHETQNLVILSQRQAPHFA